MGTIQLGRDEVRAMLADARNLQAHYDAANKANPKGHYNYGSVDEIALRMLEREGGFVTIGVKLHGASGEDVKLQGRSGFLMPDGTAIPTNGTVDYLLKGYDRASVRGFIEAVCDVVDNRVDHGSSEVRAMMVSNAKAYTNRTRTEIRQ